MPVFCFKIDSDPTKVGQQLQYEIIKQPLTLVMVHYDFYDPTTQLQKHDPYTKSLKIKLPFINHHQFMTNSKMFEGGIDIPIKRGSSTETSGTITNLGFVFEPDKDVDVNSVRQGEIFHRSGDILEKYSGYYTTEGDPSTKVNAGVTVSLYFEYDIVQFDN